MTDILLRISIEVSVLGTIAWLVSRRVPWIGASTRAILWWCVAAKVVVALVWTTPILVPVLPAPENAPTHLMGPSSPANPVDQGSSSDLKAVTVSIPWTTLFLMAWAAGVGIAITLACRQWLDAARVLRLAAPADPATLTLAHDLAGLMLLRRVPRVALTDDVESPLVTGLVRPVVLLPAKRFAAMTGEQQRMTICHELAHVRRRDLWFGLVPALAERMFFFHPVVRLAAREYHFWREAACDAVVLEVLSQPPKAYAELLLELGVCRPSSRLAAAGAARSFSILKRRMLMLSSARDVTTTSGRILTATLVMLGLAAVLPFRLSARPGEVIVHARAMPQAAAAAFETAPARIDEGTQRDKEDLRFVYVISDDQTTMSGSGDDVRRARRLRVAGEPMLWFVHDGQEFVVRDRRTLQQLDGIWAPVGRIGAEQGEIGARQGAIGAKQGEVGAKQGLIGAQQAAIGARQGTIGARQASLSAREARARSDRDWQEIAQERRNLDQAMRELDREMAALNEKMHDASKPMEELGEQMEKLGAEMEKLGAKMEAASKQAQADMRRLIERAIADGTAQPVR